MVHMKKKIHILAAAAVLSALALAGCGQAQQTQQTKQTEKPQKTEYKVLSSHEVDGRQGVASEGDYYYVSGSTTLSKYDKNWNKVAENTKPFETGYEREVNHIGDIDVYNNEIYCGVELFLDGNASNIQIAIYDADTLQLKRTFNFEPNSGQTECSGLAVNPDNNTVIMCSWAMDETGEYLYRYDLKSGAYKDKIHMEPSPKLIQGIAYNDGAYYITSDDGDADKNEPDHVYKTVIDDKGTVCKTSDEKALDDVTKQGEIEGLTFDKDKGQMLVLYNRGAIIKLGMPSGFYEGYDHEIHEVFTYEIK
jgi:hypothetical protein